MKTKKKQTFFKPSVPQPINNLSWPQAKARFPGLKPYGDADKDRVKNFRDCKPFDIRRQGKKHDEEEEYEGKEEDESWEKLTPRQRALAEEGHTLGIDGW